MKINEAISRLKILLENGIASDDTILSNRFLYSILKTLRTKRIRQKLDSYFFLSPFYYNTIDCVPLTLGKFADCPCFTNDCFILRSKYKIPKIMSTRNKLAIKAVTTITGQIISETSPTQDEYKKYTRTKKEGIFYFIHNDYLYITGTTTLKVITLTAIFENPIDLSGINACDTEGNNLPNVCFEPKSSDFPIDEDLFDDIENMALEKLYKTLRVPNDSENNAKNKQTVNDLE